MKRRKLKFSNYVMFGYKVSDPDVVGYLAKIPTCAWDEDFLTDDINLAKKFPDKNVLEQEGFGTPEQWLDFINAEFRDMPRERSYEFHLVKTVL